MSSKQFEFWFDVICPYAYIASTQVESIAERTNSTCIPKPVLLGAIFQANNVNVGKGQAFSDTMPPTKRLYMAKDLKRFCTLRGVKLRFPADHPRSSVRALKVILAVGPPFLPLAKIFFKAYWVEGLDISQESIILKILQNAGIEFPEAALEKSKSPDIDKELRQRDEEGIEKGIFGVPTFFVNGEMIYGQDRLELLEATLGGNPNVPVEAALYKRRVFPVDFYFDYSSPFTYIATTRVGRMFGEGNLTWHPMLLGGVFKLVGTPIVPMAAISEAKRKYGQLDMKRQSKGIEFNWPSNFPLRTVLALRVTLAAHPNSVRGRKLIHRIFRACWVEDQDPSDPNVITKLCNEVGLDGEMLVKAAELKEIKDQLTANTSKAIELGIFGAPSFVIHYPNKEDVMFWGNDRIEFAVMAARESKSPSSAL